MSYKVLLSLAALPGGLAAQSGVAAAAASATTPPPAVRPNVVLIYADDLGMGDLSCYGATEIATPHIDSLSARGIRFANAYAPAATSTPSRYGMLTGEYAWRRAGTDVAAGDAGMIIRPERYTLADLFRNEGYRTAAVGKWHLGLGDKTGQQDWNAPLSCDPRDIGFDYYYIMAATADRVPCVFIENGRVVDFDPAHPIEVSYNKPFEGEPLGATHPEQLTKLRHSHGHDMAIVNGIGRIGYMRGGGKALWRDEDIADSITRKGVEFIERSAHEPFFLYLAPNDVHVPRYPHERFRGQSRLGLRGDAILQLDWTVGQVVATLRRLGLLERTIIVISSDNGAVVDDGYLDEAKERLGQHRPSLGLRSYKYSAFEGGSRIPAIVYWEQTGQTGRVSREVVSQIDWFASFAALLGAKIPHAGGVAPDSGANEAAWLLGGESRRPYVIMQAASKTLAVRAGRWKYIEPSNGPQHIPWGPDPAIETGYSAEPQLYDLERDPSERKNLARRYPDIVARMADILERERARTSGQ